MDENKVITVNNSLGKPNYTQRLNPDDPSTPWNETNETCNVTAAISALGSAGWDLDKLNKGLHKRAAMDLLYFMRQNKVCQDMYDSLDPAHGTPMNEYMSVLAAAMREYTGSRDMWLVHALDRSVIVRCVAAGGTAVIHGDFTFTRANGSKIKSGHYQALVGYRCSEAGVTDWIVDDPWGDPNTEYLSQMGDNVVLPITSVTSMIKPIGTGGKDAILVNKHVE